LFMLSTSLSVDLYKTFLEPGISEQKLLRVSRITSVAAGILGIVLAALLQSIIAAVSIFYGLIAVALFVPVIAGLYSRRVLSAAAITSIVSAVSVTVVIMRLTANRGFGLFSPQALGIATAAVVMIGFRFVHPGVAQADPAFAGGADTR
jgi:SSS family solute:Na+ symporter